ncbi:hypothetical protein ETB97_002363 [Aspergillus alliaceus]|uniref:Hemerythrin-like domain-containing protein n=1 Tax=Petromyces alliaceus TaxID=209559 RepID=A0A8H6A2X2_PETAA|nr:hypothetical protein ETB97_002363 [Aspergillus burnettii]
MITTSVIPKEWANKSWPLITSPQCQGHDIHSHFSVFMATDRYHVHNLFIHSMNSIYRQSPYVTKPADIADLLFYTKCLVDCINAHHDGEEKYLFPGLIEYTKNPDIMAVNQAQHALFHGGMQTLLEYCVTTSPADYSHQVFQGIIDSFATPLFQHLSDEIGTILALKSFPSQDLKLLWTRAEKHINKVGSFDEMFPLAFGCIDNGFEAGQHKFPPVSKLVNFVVKYC